MPALKPYSPPTDFVFTPADHIGRYKGEVWPSVTQLLQEYKLIDYSGAPEDILERKRILGTRVHYATGLLDDCDLNEEDTATHYPEILPYLEAYRKFRIQQPFEPAPECGRLLSLRWKFHGEPDEHGIRVENFGNKLALIDYKCTWKMYESTGAQLAAYAILLEECHGIKVQARYGLLLKSNGSYDVVPFTDAIEKQDFLACLHLHWRRRNKYKTLTLK